MKNHRLIALVAAVVMLGPINARAGEIKVIANPSIRTDSIALTELRSIFLEEKRSLRDGSHAEPVLARSGAAHEAFVRDYLGKTDDALQNYYRTLVFTGTGPMPKMLTSDTEIVAYVASTRGAIGYVEVNAPTDGVKVLTVLQAESKSERKPVVRVEPEYPGTLLRLHIGGTVRLALTISPKGTVEDIQLLGGNPILAEAAIKAIKQWVFTPSYSRTKQVISIPFTPQP